MSHQRVEKASIAWVLLAFHKIKSIGQEPYVFVPGSTLGVTVQCLVGWDDGWSTGDVMEYDSSPEGKLNFIQAFDELYPTGAIATL